MRRWLIVVVTVLAVLDLAVLAVGYRTRAGALPGWKVPEPEFTMLPPGTPSGTATGVTADTITGPVLLAIDANGLVLRATRGACEERFANPAQVAVGSISTGVTAVELPALAEVLGVAILPEDHLRVSGLDQDCEEVTVDSTDSGQTWQPWQGSAGIWRLDPDTTAEQVTGPVGANIPLGCAPQYVTNLAGSRGAVSCRDSVYYLLVPRAAPLALSASGYDQLSVAGGPRSGRYFVFGATAECGARVAAASSSQPSVSRLACLGGERGPLAIAAAGGYVVVQVGDDLMVSEDGGRHFADVA